MKNRFISFAVATTFAMAFAPVYASNPACKSIAITAPGKLYPTDCYKSGVLAALANSGQYPDVFSAKKYIFPDLPAYIPDTSCYVSPKAGFAATIDGDPVVITTASAWTNDTKPVLFYPFNPSEYTDNLGAVITKISVFDLSGKFQGDIFSRDVVDLSHFADAQPSSIEQDTIIGGTRRFTDAKGTFRIESKNITNPTVSVPVDTLKGVLCTADD